MFYKKLQRIIILATISTLSSCQMNIIHEEPITLTGASQIINIEDHIHSLSPLLCKWDNTGWIFQWYTDSTTQINKHSNSLLCSAWANLIKKENTYIYLELSGSIIYEYPLQHDTYDRYWLGKTEVYNPQGCVERSSDIWRTLFWAFDWVDKKMNYYNWNISTFLYSSWSVGCFDMDSMEKILNGSDFFWDKNGIYWIVPISVWPGQRWTKKTKLKALEGNDFIFLDWSRLNFLSDQNQ